MRAQRLDGTHIGETIEFTMVDPNRRITTTVLAELRQIYHIEGEVHLTVGYGAEVEYTLDPDTPISLVGDE